MNKYSISLSFEIENLKKTIVYVASELKLYTFKFFLISLFLKDLYICNYYKQI